MTLAVLMGGLFTRDVDAADRPTTRNGLPCFYREVEVARPGRYQAIRGQTVTLTVAELDRLAERFARMRAVGVDVPIVRGGRERAVDALGWTVGLRRDGARLLALLQLVGDDAAWEAGVSRFGVVLDPAFRDGFGTAYGLAVRSIASKPTPYADTLSRLRAGKPMSSEPITVYPPTAVGRLNLSRELWGPAASPAPADLVFYEFD